MVAHKLLNGYICNPNVLQRVALYVPGNFTRTKIAVQPPFFSKRYDQLPLILPLGNFSYKHFFQVKSLMNICADFDLSCKII